MKKDSLVRGGGGEKGRVDGGSSLDRRKVAEGWSAVSSGRGREGMVNTVPGI